MLLFYSPIKRIAGLSPENVKNGLNLSCVKVQQDVISCGFYIAYSGFTVRTGCTSELDISANFLPTVPDH